MVDSQVTLQIGTELDLSGLQRDLAKLKSTKFDFDIDPNKLGRQFREANRQMVLSPKVDMKQLHELNRLLDVKVKHFKAVQRQFNNNPLKIKVDNRELLPFLAAVAKSGTLTVKMAESKRGESGIVSELKKITANTKKDKGGIGSAVGKIVTAPLKLGTKLISDAFVGFGEEIGRTLSQELVSGNVKKGVNKTKSAIKAVNDFFIGNDKVYETLLAEILRSGNLVKAGKAAYKRTSVAKEVGRLQKLQEIATIPAKKRGERLSAIKSDPALFKLFEESMQRAEKENPNMKRMAVLTTALDDFFNSAVPKGISKNIIDPFVKELRPFLRFIQGMQSYNTSVLSERYYKERKASFPILEKGENVVSVIGGAQGEKGQGGRKLAPAFQAVDPTTRFIPVENPDTDNTGRNPLEGWFKEQLSNFGIDSGEVESMVLNAFRQVSFALSPTANSVAAAQALANTRLAQEQGAKASVMTYSLGGAEGLRFSAAAEYEGVDANVLATAYPYLNLLGQSPKGFQAQMLKGDALGFATKFGLGEPTEQFTAIDSPVYGAEAHAPYHLFKQVEFLQTFFETIGNEMPDVDPTSAADLVRFGNQLYELLGVAEQVKSLATTGEFSMESPFKGFRGEDTSGQELIARFGESFSVVESMQSAKQPQVKALGESIAPVFEEAKKVLVESAKASGVELPEDPKDLAGFLKFGSEVKGVNLALKAFKTGVLPKKEEKAYFAGKLNPQEITKRMAVLENETISWFSQHKGQFGSFGDDLVDIFTEVKRVATEFVATGGNLSDEFKATIQEFPEIDLPDEFQALMQKQLNTLLLPSEEEARQNLVPVTKPFKENQAGILAFNQLVEVFEGIIPPLEEIEAIGYGMSGAAALIGENLVYKTDLDPEGAQKIAAPQEMEAYKRLQGRLAPLMYKGDPGKGLITERVKGKSLKDILDRIAKPIVEMSAELETETDEKKKSELRQKIDKAKARFNKAAEILYTQVGQLGSAMQEMGVAHGDLASGNVFFTQKGISAIDLGNAKVDPSTMDKVQDQITTIQRAVIDQAFFGILDPIRTGKAIQSGYKKGMPIPEARTVDKSLMVPSTPGKAIPLGSKDKPLLTQYAGELSPFPAMTEEQSAEVKAIVKAQKQKKGKLAKAVQKGKDKIETVIITLTNNALSQVPGEIGTIDISAPQIQSLEEINMEVIGTLAGKGLHQAAITATEGISSAYGVLQGAEEAVLGLDPTGAAKMAKRVAAPLALTAAATQVPGLGPLVSGAVDITAGALTPYANTLAAAIIDAVGAAVHGAVAGFPVVGGALEAGLMNLASGSVTAALAGATGVAAAGAVGQGMIKATGAVAGAIAPASGVERELTKKDTQRALTGALAKFDKITSSLSKSKLAGTTAIFPKMIPPVKDEKQIRALLDKNLKVTGLKEVFKSLTGTSGGKMNRAALLEAIVEKGQSQPKLVQQAIGKVSEKGLKAGADISTLGRPVFDEAKFIGELQKVAKGSQAFISQFDAVGIDIKEQASEGLATLIDVIEFQIKAIETVKKEFATSGKGGQQIGGYESNLKSQLEQLQKRQKDIGKGIGKDLTRGLSEGINKESGKALEAAKDLAEDVIETTEDKFGIQSPSKVFAKIGKYIVKGLQEGGDITHYLTSLSSEIQKFVASTKSQQSKIDAAIAIETDPATLAYLKAIQSVTDETKAGAVDASVAFQLLQSSLNDLSPEQAEGVMRSILVDLNEAAAKLEDTTFAPTVDEEKAKAALATQDEIPVTIGSVDVSEPLQEIENTEPIKEWRDVFDEIALSITGIESISKKSFKTIGLELAKNFDLTGVKKAFNELQATVSQSFVNVFGGAMGARGEVSRQIQGMIGRVAIGMTKLTTILSKRLEGLLLALRGSISGALDGIDKFTQDIGKNLKKLGLLVAGVFVFSKIIKGMTAFGKASFQTALQMEELLRTLSFSSSSSGVSTLEMLKQKADELSISFRESAQGYSQLAASTMGTRLEGATEDIFTGVATAVSARGLSNDQQSRAFMAISQIAAKGRVSMEELNQQLGEALPGALQTAARAMGMTTAELIKLVSTGGLMAEEFLPRFAEQLALEAGSSVAAAAGTATAQLTKFNNQLELLQAETGKPILGVLAAVLPTMNALLKLVADNIGLILPIVGTLAAALSFTLGKAILVVASELKLVNLFLSVFGIQLQGTMTAAGKAGVSIMGLGGAFKGLMASALPLIGIGLIFAGIVDAITPANEEMANAIKRMKELKRLEGAGAEKETATGDELLRITQEEIAARERNKFGAVELSKGALEGTIRAGQGGLTPKMLIPGYQQAQGFGTLLGLTIAQGTKDRIKLDKLTTKFGETSATAIKDIAESFKLPTDELRNEINQLDKEIRAKTFELNIAQAGGEDITELQAQLDELRDKRKVKIETEFPRYGELIGQISDVEKQINTITEKTQKGELSPEVFAQEYPKLVAQLEELQGYADEYADTTKVTKENIQEMAAALAQVQISMERATITAKQTTTEDLMALMDQRMAGTIDPVEFAQRQADITRKEVEAIAKATKQGRDDIQSQIDALNADTTNALNMAFKEIGFSDGLAQVLADGGSEAIEEAKRILASQGELDPAIEQALMKLERYAGLRDESIELEKQLAELELDRRQQEIDALQKIIDLENTRAQALINQSNLEAEIGLTAKQARGQLSDFQVQLLNFANQAKTAREEAKMLEASAKRNERAALEADLPEAREEFIRNATREALESQLKEQQAALADTQARVAMAMRPIELAQQLAQTRNEEQQLSDQIAVNIRTAARALTDFDKQYMGMIAQVNSLLTEVANLEDAAKAKREAAVTPGLAPDEQRRLEREARSDELMAAQKRSEIDLAKAEFNRASQMRDFELATRQATNANEELFLTRKLAIAQEQATATDAQSIAMANMVAQEKNLKAEQEYIQRKISLINRQIQEVQSLTMAGVIDMDSYNERIASLTAERLNLQNESVQRQIQLNQQEIDGFRFIGDQLVKLNEIRNQALEAQLKGYDRMTQAGNVYSDALGKEAELMQSQSDNAKKAADEMVQGLDKLQGTSGLMDNLRSTLGLDFLVTKKDKEAQAKLRKQVDDLLKQTKIQLGNANLDELQPIQLVELRQQLEQAKKLGIEGIDLGFEGFLKIQDEIARKNQQLADQKQQALDKEQASQRALLEIEAKRNRLAAQSAIREAEVAALRAKQSLIIAKNKEMSAVDPNEVMMAQLNVEMAEDELNFAMMGIDIAKQNAIFADELNQAKAQGLAIEQKIATQALEGIERTPFPEFKTSDFQGWKDAQEYRRARSAMRRATARGESFDWREEYSIPDYLKPQVSELDGSSVVDALMGISQTMESMVDLTKYDEMLSQLDKAAQPLEDQISIERQSLQATQGLTAGIDTLNQRIERLITTLGRPNISVGGDGSVAPAIEIMRASEQITRRI